MSQSLTARCRGCISAARPQVGAGSSPPLELPDDIPLAPPEVPPVQETVLAPPAEVAARIERSQAALVKQSSPGPIEVVSAGEAAPAEDPITRLKRLARDRGLLSPGSTRS